MALLLSPELRVDPCAPPETASRGAGQPRALALKVAGGFDQVGPALQEPAEVVDQALQDLAGRLSPERRRQIARDVVAITWKGASQDGQQLAHVAGPVIGLPAVLLQ